MVENNTARALLPQSPYKKFSLKPYHIKYYGMIAVFLMMIAAVRVFINYATIQSSIQQVMQETVALDRHKQYVAMQSYVYSLPESQIFISHDNGIILPGDRVFMKIYSTGTKIQESTISTGSKVQSEVDLQQLPPIQSWIRYFVEKID